MRHFVPANPLQGIHARNTDLQLVVLSYLPTGHCAIVIQCSNIITTLRFFRVNVIVIIRGT